MQALNLLRQIITVSLLINLFMFGCEIFKELYSGSLHAASAEYLLFGLHGYDALVPWIWSALTLEVIAAIILITPLAHNQHLVQVACLCKAVFRTPYKVEKRGQVMYSGL